MATSFVRQLQRTWPYGYQADGDAHRAGAGQDGRYRHDGKSDRTLGHNDVVAHVAAPMLGHDGP